MPLNEQLDCRFCRLHLSLCVCHLMPHHDLPVRITVVMHRREYFKKTNTGHFLPRIFSNCHLLWHGHENRIPFSHEDLLPASHENILLFPAPRATELSGEFCKNFSRPLNLVIFDGSWRQAGKMVRRVRMLQPVPVVSLPVGQVSRYRLRATKTRDTVCTLEAVARAMGVFAGNAPQQELEFFLDAFVTRMLLTRGKGSLNPPLQSRQIWPQHAGPLTICRR